MSCCRVCKTHLDVCREKACQCHQRERNLDHDTQTHRDPTAWQAIRNADNPRKKKK